MTVFDGEINEFAVGDDLAIERTIEDIPDGAILATAWLMVKKQFSHPDDEAIITKTITTASADDGQITDSGADGTGLLLFYLDAADTALLTPIREYKYSIKVKLDNDRVYTPEVGNISAYPTVKRGNT